MNKKLSAQLEELATNELPDDVGIALKAIYKVSGQLQKIASTLKVKKKFTPDGRLIGDIGELIAAQKFKVELNPTSKKGHDGILNKKEIEIKTRSHSSLIWLSSDEHQLLVLYISPITFKWGVVYHGPASKILKNRKNKNKRFEVDLSDLLKNPSPPNKRKKINAKSRSNRKTA